VRRFVALVALAVVLLGLLIDHHLKTKPKRTPGWELTAKAAKAEDDDCRALIRLAGASLPRSPAVPALSPSTPGLRQLMEKFKPDADVAASLGVDLSQGDDSVAMDIAEVELEGRQQQPVDYRGIINTCRGGVRQG
jgi:hypothetical protein